MKINNLKNKQGFTLIELVVVIVILGILAVTAAPKFINLQSDARTATLQAIKASMETATALVHSKSLIAGNETKAASATNNVVINSAGTTVSLDLGYPISTTGSGTAAGTDWGNLLDVNTTEFTISDSAIAGYVVVYPTDSTAPTAIPTDVNAPAAPTTTTKEDCFAFYKETATLGTKPTMNVAVCL